MTDLPLDFYQGLVEHNADAILAVTEDGCVRFANPATEILFRRPISQIVGFPFGFPISGDGAQEIEIIQPNGVFYVVEMRVEKTSYQSQTYYIASLRDITEYAMQREELNTLSFKDSLTGLYNRRGFFNLAYNQIKKSHRNKQCLTLIYLDLDGLKQINDTYGHNVGDQALVASAELLKRVFRESDIKARIGGDEFLVLVIDTNQNINENLLSRFKEHLKLFNQTGELPFCLCLSSGVSYFHPEDPVTLDELLKQADNELYKQKANNKGCVY